VVAEGSKKPSGSKSRPMKKAKVGGNPQSSKAERICQVHREIVLVEDQIVGSRRLASVEA
jgi:hypothetical protein